MRQMNPALVSLVQQGVWDAELESMPLACGYLKAIALADDRIRARTQIDIHNFRGGVTLPAMANRLFTDQVPDVLGISVFGWTYRSACALAETAKQLNAKGWVIFGGTHVSHQADRIMRMCPEVDVIVNDEGELTFRDLLVAYLDGADRYDLGCIPGISYRTPSGIRTTAPRPRIENLDVIPSPVLTGAIPLTDQDGRFRYDVALMETNRGCPYHCAFCYWGGAVGQKVRGFSRERLRAELELYGKLQVHTIVLCDANFGLLAQDKTFVEDLIEIRDQYGYPRSLETSWAKNKSRTFYDIVSRMKQEGMRSSFTLALQTLDEKTLDIMDRRNMKVNSWKDLVDWLRSEGLDCYAELIWGAPGETVDTFLRGYDALARDVSRIAVYPMLLLPNTSYMAKKAQHGIITVRGDTDDFESILATRDISFADYQGMEGFLFWARVGAENMVFRHIWRALRELAGITQSQAVTDLGAWIARVDDPAAAPLRAAADRAFEGVGIAAAYLFTDPAATQLLRRWWTESIRPRLGPDAAPLLDAIFAYDLITQPVVRAGDLPVMSIRGEDYYLRRGVVLSHDVPAALAALRAGRAPDTAPAATVLDLYYKTGADRFLPSTNHEEILYYMGLTSDELAARDVGSRPQPAAVLAGDQRPGRQAT